MIPGVDPRQMKAMMRQMGISSQDLSAVEVIITTPEKIFRFKSPSVQQISMRGDVTFQVSGDFVEEDVVVNVQISDEDIELVSSRTGVSKDVAKSALKQSKGDIAQAIIDLSD